MPSKISPPISKIPPQAEHSLRQLLDRMRVAWWDIVEFAVNPKRVSRLSRRLLARLGCSPRRVRRVRICDQHRRGLDDTVLAKPKKNYTRQDFIEAAHLMRAVGLPLSPTFIPFTPWTTAESMRDLLRALAALELIESVAPIQLGIRLLIPEGSRMLELEEIRKILRPFDANSLTYPWQHPDPTMDELSAKIQSLAKTKQTRAELFAKI